MQTEHIVIDAHRVELEKPLHGAENVKHGGRVGRERAARRSRSNKSGRALRPRVECGMLIGGEHF